MFFYKARSKEMQGTQKKEQRPKYAFMPKASPTESLKAQVPQGFTLLLFYKERNANKCKETRKMQKRRRKNVFFFKKRHAKKHETIQKNKLQKKNPPQPLPKTKMINNNPPQKNIY